MNKFLVKEPFKFDKNKDCPQPIAVLPYRDHVAIVQEDGTGEITHWVVLTHQDVAEFVDALVSLVPQQFNFMSVCKNEDLGGYIARTHSALKHAQDYASNSGSSDGTPRVFAITTNLFVKHEQVTVSLTKDASDEEILRLVKAALK